LNHFSYQKKSAKNKSTPFNALQGLVDGHWTVETMVTTARGCAWRIRDFFGAK